MIKQTSQTLRKNMKKHEKLFLVL